MIPALRDAQSTVAEELLAGLPAEVTAADFIALLEGATNRLGQSQLP